MDDMEEMRLEGIHRREEAGASMEKKGADAARALVLEEIGRDVVPSDWDKLFLDFLDGSAGDTFLMGEFSETGRYAVCVQKKKGFWVLESDGVLGKGWMSQANVDGLIAVAGEKGFVEA